MGHGTIRPHGTTSRAGGRNMSRIGSSFLLCRAGCGANCLVHILKTLIIRLRKKETSKTQLEYEGYRVKAIGSNRSCTSDDVHRRYSTVYPYPPYTQQNRQLFGSSPACPPLLVASGPVTPRKQYPHHLCLYRSEYGQLTSTIYIKGQYTSRNNFLSSSTRPQLLRVAPSCNAIHTSVLVSQAHPIHKSYCPRLR